MSVTEEPKLGEESKPLQYRKHLRWNEHDPYRRQRTPLSMWAWLLQRVSALAREETRGAHSRADFPKQRDDYGLFNSYLRRGDDGRPAIEKRPVRFTRKSLEECQNYRKG